MRILNLEGSCNFRDIGGYRTRDGRELRWGRVFRTGVLSYVTADDQPQLTQLGVRVICDLRRADERDREQTRWPDANTQHLNWEDKDTPPTIGLIAAKHPYTAVGVRTTMIEFYRALPAWIVPRFRDMLKRIAQGDVPILVHCAAGQDRTGIAIALLLSLLDVPIDTITEDYLLTNDACNHVQFMLKQYQAKLGTAVSAHPLLKMPEDIRHAIFTAHADYLHAALDQIDRDHGNVREYLRKEIGVNDSMRANVQQALLS